MLLSIKNLHVIVDNTQVLKGLTLSIESGTTHVIMGPNGAGKSSLANTLMGHPSYKATDGTIIFEGNDLLDMEPHERALAGIFLSFQSPCEIEGIPLRDLMRQAYNARNKKNSKRLGIRKFNELVDTHTQTLGLPKGFADRSVNLGFSGGEKKRAEMLQLMVLQPKLAILDEIDSGLDIDATNAVFSGLKTLQKELPDMTLLIITHYPTILAQIETDQVHIVQDGKIIESGDATLADKIGKTGFAKQ